MIRVLQVMEATEGGTRRHLRDLVAALDPDKIHLEMAVSCLRDSDFRRDLAGFAARGISVREITMRRGIAPFSDLLSLIRLVACIWAVRPDVVHAHSSKAGALARVAGRLCGVPVVYTPHGFSFLMRCGSVPRRFYQLVESALAGWTSALIAVSTEESQAALSSGYPPERVRLIRNGVEPCDTAEVVVRESDTLQVGFFGRLSPQKSPETLLDAIADVVAHIPKTHFNLYGAGKLAPKLAKKIQSSDLAKHVRIMGAYAQDEAVAKMRQMDVVAVPSLWEGCPYVVLEAFQAGVPVVAAHVGGICDLIEDGVNGILTEPGNAESLCDGLLQVLRDAELRARLARNGRASLARHTLAEMAEKVCAVYGQVAGEDG